MVVLFYSWNLTITFQSYIVPCTELEKYQQCANVLHASQALFLSSSPQNYIQILQMESHEVLILREKLSEIKNVAFLVLDI